MLFQMAAPGQTIYAAWVSYAIMNAPSVQSFNLVDDRRLCDAVARPHGGARHHPVSSRSRRYERPAYSPQRSATTPTPSCRCCRKARHGRSMRPAARWCMASSGLCDYWGFVDGRAADLLERESDPRQTVELLPDWERNWGLPDPCYEAPQTIGERQLALVMRMTMQGAQSREFFIDVAAHDRLHDHHHRVSHLRRRHRPLRRQSRLRRRLRTPCTTSGASPIMNANGEHVAEGELSEWPYYGLGPPEQPLLLDRACRTRPSLIWFRVTQRASAASIRICASVSPTILSACSTDGSQRTPQIIFDYSGLGKPTATHGRARLSGRKRAMKYNQPYGVSDPNAPYINGNPVDRHDGLDPASGIDRVSAARDRQPDRGRQHRRADQCRPACSWPRRSSRRA